MAVWCDRKNCGCNAINKGEIIDCKEAIGKGYCLEIHIHLDKNGKCQNFYKKGTKPIYNKKEKEELDKALNDLINY